jgi:acetaldehyde dehydrogenase
MIKLMRSELVEVDLMVGIFPESAGLQRAREAGIDSSADGLDAVLARDEVQLVFDATSAQSHKEHAPRLAEAGKRVIDLTPAAVGPYVVPAVNLSEHRSSANVNLVTCGGQATIPFVHAVSRVTPVAYSEIVATIASAGAGPGTRQNIDEFTETTSRGLEVIGGAAVGKAIIILNPAEPPLLMRNTIYAEIEGEPDHDAIKASVETMALELQAYVPGLRLLLCEVDGAKVTIMTEVAGAGDFLPVYAGNLDVMTAAATRVGEAMAEEILGVVAA